MGKCGKAYSEIKDCGGTPALFVNGKPFASVAYMTYLEQYNDYEGFARAGYNFFSAPVLFAGRWINASADTPAFKKGLFDNKTEPEFSLFDETVGEILRFCPDAYIIPRVNVSLPEWWERDNPCGVNIKADGRTLRESMYSPKWRENVTEMLKRFVRYVNGTEYASHIVGYQLAGGNTEEWFHFDLNAGYCKNAEEGFKSFLADRYPGVSFKGLPDLTKLNKKTAFHNDGYLSAFLEYASFAVADAITQFAAAVKEETDNRIVVGTFYGYSLEVASPLWGTHALKVLLRDKNVDFICSPCSYAGNRGPDSDMTEMYPAASVRLHGKMCFQECDIRTNLTVLLSEKDILLDPNRVYTAPVWKGPETKEESLSVIRKAFCRQLVKGNGLWWFDMWGGWYSDSTIMNEMKRYKDIYAASLGRGSRQSSACLAVFADEMAYCLMTDCALRNATCDQRKALGLLGAPYDIYDVSDFKEVINRYKAVIFTAPVKTENMKYAVSFCRKNGIPYLRSTVFKPTFTVTELRAFCEDSGIGICCESNDVVYIGNNYAAIHAVTDGMKELRLFSKKTIRKLLPESGETAVSDTIKAYVKKGETVLYEIW